jgi:hypothetical protein
MRKKLKIYIFWALFKHSVFYNFLASWQEHLDSLIELFGHLPLLEQTHQFSEKIILFKKKILKSGLVCMVPFWPTSKI